MKSTDRILAQRYARAYDALSKNDSDATRACQALCAAVQALRQAQGYMHDPAVSSAEKTDFVHALFKQEPHVENLLKALLQAKRYYLLEPCAAEVQKLADKRLGIVRAQVETAFELSAAQKKKVEEVLSEFSGKHAQANFKVNPHLLGGFRARLEDTLIDGSLQGKFKKLEEELTK